jgi:hypothetical protein
MAFWIFQYQAQTEPVSTRPETVTESRWHQPWSEPVRQKIQPALAIALMASGQFAPAPLPIPTPAPAIISIALAEPVLRKPAVKVHLFPADTAGLENILLSKWFNPLSEPVRIKPALGAHLQQFQPYNETQQFPETVTESRWHQPWSEPVRRVGIPTGEQQAIAFVPLPIVPVGFYQPWSEPVWQKPAVLAANQQVLAFAPNPIVSFGWFNSLSDPAKPKSAVATASQQSAIISSQPVVSFGWFEALVDPPRIKRPPVSDSFFAAPVFTTTEIITVDKWFEPLSDFARAKPQSTEKYKGENEWTAVAAAMKWYAPLAEPVRTKPGLATSLQQAYFSSLVFTAAEVITVDKWFEQLSDPTRRIPAAKQVTIVEWTAATTVEIITVDKWFVPFTDPAKRFNLLANQQQAYFSSQVFTTAEVVTVDKWFVPFTEILRRKPDANQYDGDSRFAAVSVRLKWFSPLSEPVRQKIGLPVTEQQAYFSSQVFTAEIVTVDKWFRLFTDPVRTKPALATGLQQTLALAPTPPIVSFSWYNWLSDPAKAKTSILAAAQQPLAFAPFPITPPLGWFVAFSDPAKPKISILAASQQFYTAPINPTVSFSWYGWLSDPAKPKTSVGPPSQQFFVFSPSPIVSFGWYGALSDPTRRIGIQPSQQQVSAFWPFPLPTIVPSFGYFAPLSEPAKPKTSIIAANQQFWTYGTPPIILVINMRMDVTEQGDFLQAVLFQFNVPIKAYVDIIEKNPHHGGDAGIIENTGQSSIIVIPGSPTPVLAGARVAIITP